MTQVVELGVKVGQIVTNERLEEYKKASEYGKAYQRALEWALVRPRSVKELKEYLRRRRRLAEVKKQKDSWQKEKEIAEMIAQGETEMADRMRGKMVRTQEREGLD